MRKTADVYSGSILLYRGVEIADSFFPRFLGFMGRREPGCGGIHLLPCNSVHMFFMNFPLDIVFLDRSGEVVQIVEQLAPRKLSPTVRNAYSVLELPAGAARHTGLKTGETLTFRPAKSTASDTAADTSVG